MMRFIKPTQGLITSFKQDSRPHPITEVVKPHGGCDIGWHGTDDIVVASASGIVTVPKFSKVAGNYILIKHDFGWTSVYSHLKTINVKTGQRVKQGQRIGIKGTTGGSRGVHLHFEIITLPYYTSDNSKKVNPIEHFIDPTTREWQGWLREMKLYGGAVDGIYGNGTVEAVMKYQKSNGLTPDGVCGRNTYNHIKNAYTKFKNNKKKEEGVLTMSQYQELKGIISVLQKEIDYLNKEKTKQLPGTQRKDLKELFEHAYKKGIFHSDHTHRVDKMTSEEALNLVMSYVSRSIS